MTKRSKLPYILLLTLFINLALSVELKTQSGSQYTIELPEAFLQTLAQDTEGKTILWHPRLTVTQIHKTNQAVLDDTTKKFTNPRFKSFLAVEAQTDPGLSTTSSSGSAGKGSLSSSQLGCDCRFIKDPTADAAEVSLLEFAKSKAGEFLGEKSKEKQQTDNKKFTTYESSNSLLENHKDNLEKTSEVEDKKLDKNEVLADSDDDDLKKLLELKKQKEAEKAAKAAGTSSEDDELQQLLQLKKQLESQKKQSSENEKEELKKQLLLEIQQEQENQKKEQEKAKLKEEIKALLQDDSDDSTTINNKQSDFSSFVTQQSSNNQDMAQFAEFVQMYQNYQNYQNMLTMNQQKKSLVTKKPSINDKLLALLQEDDSQNNKQNNIDDNSMEELELLQELKKLKKKQNAKTAIADLLS